MPIAQASIVQSQSVNDHIVRRRSKGERTREKILLAAIDVLAINGIKGTTHRAIANHAELQLSLTTYYFKDICELIQQAFQLNSDNLSTKNENIFQDALLSLAHIDKTSLRKVAIRKALCEELANMIAHTLLDNIKKEATALAVEQLMFTAMHVSPELKKLAHAHEQYQLAPLSAFVSYFNKKDPEIDAKMMRTIISQLQYSQLSIKPSELSIDAIEEVTKRLMSWIMGLKH